ncbi:MAG: zinc ribbon domain-containing protein [Oscillospiraceae bacterium]|nr:zinc ribbon domain-containing protein [Oscillospiraceae bacterium]
MAFMDNLRDAARKTRETVKDAAAYAGEKTKNFVEVQKLKSQIHDEERVIENCKKEIGEIYWKKYLAQVELDGEITDICVKISASLEKIDDLNEEIKNYKDDQVTCPNCGSEYPRDTAFCAKCGRDLRGE